MNVDFPLLKCMIQMWLSTGHVITFVIAILCDLFLFSHFLKISRIHSFDDNGDGDFLGVEVGSWGASISIVDNALLGNWL